MELVVLSRDAAERYQPTGHEICVSIADPDVPPAGLSDGFAAVLRLAFSDVVAAQVATDVLFGGEHAAAILRFVEQWPDAERLVVHCHVGASRSPGVALGLCDVFGWPTVELERCHPAWNRWVRKVLATHRSTPRAG
jgi:predicted protein tyrosine phosphatase